MNPIHEETYTAGVASVVHRSRLRAFLSIIKSLDLPPFGSLGDFGCSNGFIIQTLAQHKLPGTKWTYSGFDQDARLLALAREKDVPRAEFSVVDLNQAGARGPFDVVTCLETLEHVGNLQNAIRTLFASCRPGGHIIVSVPKEIGLPGLAKFIGRRIIRGKNAYANFFVNGKSEAAYIKALLLNKRIDGFRDGSRTGWGFHLGFDLRAFERLLPSTKAHRTSFFGFNQFYIFHP
jgi:2-polyprenyl-3-methyl-5-hydroxy-6-metoxy-1,4-benzoquinol methylase